MTVSDSSITTFTKNFDQKKIETESNHIDNTNKSENFEALAIQSDKKIS